jgi:XTP/dITP diphosphohydrolase
MSGVEELIFATHNDGKVKEVKALLNSRYEVLSLHDICFNEAIPETSDTFEGNALLKAELIYTRLKKNCFADDSGLEADALDGEPGVYSARYAGEGADSEACMNKLLSRMEGVENRSARFRTVIALILDGKSFLFEGVVKGTISEEKRGASGFGYDPVFIPEGHKKTFAEMTPEEKNSISHRAEAMKKLLKFLNG